MRRHRMASAVAAIVLLTSACGNSAPDRSTVLETLATDTIIPTLEQLATDTAALNAAIDELCAAPTPATLAASREALSSARASWSTSEAMWVGPVMERRSWAVIDWPIKSADIEALIADTSIVLDNERLARRIAANQRGLGAIDYILGDPENSTATLDGLTDERRCTYLTGIAAVIADEAALLPDDWDTGFEDGVPWTVTFADPETAGLDMVVNDALFLLEAMTDGELGTALGEMGDADPDGIVEGPAGLGAQDLAGHLQGLRAVLVGSNGTDGLSPLLGDDTTQRLFTAFDDADIAVAAINGPLTDAVAEQTNTVREARNAIADIQVLVATEVVSRLGVTIGFSDADGDTGS